MVGTQVTLIPARDCFVTLPARLFDPPTVQSGPTTLRLQWTPEVGLPKRCWVGWGGKVTAQGSSCIGIPAHLAKGLNLAQDMHVEVYVETEAEVSTMVHVEPESPDDWEILELNASFVETNLLEQINVMTEGCPFPIWINNSVIFLRLVSVDGKPSATEPSAYFSSASQGFAKLAPFRSEVVVKPVSRIQAKGPPGEEGAPVVGGLTYPAVALRLQPFPALSSTNPDNGGDDDEEEPDWRSWLQANEANEVLARRHQTRCIYVSDSTFLQLTTEKRSKQSMLVSGLGGKSAQREFVSLRSTDPTSKVQRVDVLRLVVWSRVCDGHICIPAPLRHALQIPNFDRVHVQLVTLTSRRATRSTQPIFSIRLCEVAWSPVEDADASKRMGAAPVVEHLAPPSDVDLVEAFDRWLSRQIDAVPLTNGCVIPLYFGPAAVETTADSPDDIVGDPLDRADDSEQTQNGYRCYSIWINHTEPTGASGVGTGDEVRADAGEAQTRIHTTMNFFVFDMFSTTASPSKKSGSQRSALATLPLPDPVAGVRKEFKMAPDDFLVQLRTNASIFLRSAGDARKRRKAPGNSSSMPHANGTISSTTITTMTTTTSSPPPPPHAFTSLYRDEQLAVRLSDLKGHDAAAETALTQLSVMLNRKLIAARQRLSTPAPGCLLLCSSAGCGRTMLAMGMASFLSRQVDTLANTVWISCKDLVGDKISTIKKTLSTALRLARRRAPSVLVLDDLDALVPHEDQSDGGVNVRTAQLAEFVADLFSDHSFELSCAAATQMRVDHVGIVATASSPTSLHVGLRATGLFTFRVDLKAPNAAARQGILGKLLSLHEGRLRSQAGCAMGLHTELDLNDQAAATEGYTCHDLRQVVERVVHASTIRCLKRQQAEQATRPGDGQLSVMVGVEDFETALDGFVPSSLKDLKLATSSVSWADIGGLDEARSTLKDTLELPSRYQRLFAQVPLKLRSGLLLYGPPGCGKTLLASAVAQECGLNFISVKGPELLNKYIGQSEQAVRDAFGRAAAAAPSILFFDEFEAIAPKRGGDSTGVTDRVVNQLLTFLDGVESRTGVYVLGASSRPDLIDPALLRPGRLDKCVYCGVPDVGERESILRACSRKLEMDPDVDLAAIARQADYYTGADLQAIVSSVQLEMVHESLDAALKGKKEGAKLTAAGLPSASQRHFDKAFQGSSLSLSAKERAKFTKIYSKFINARSDRSDQEFDPKGNMKTAMA